MSVDKISGKPSAFVSAAIAFVACITAVAGELPLDRPLTLKQAGWCFDHHYHAEPDTLILYECKQANNQKFIVRQQDGWDYIHLASNLDERCLGVSSKDVDGSGKPKSEAPIVFKTCDGIDPLINWKYQYGMQQLHLASFPELCMDFSDTHDLFIVYECKKDSGRWEAQNQRVEFHDYGTELINEGMPVEIQHVTQKFADWTQLCLDQKSEDELCLWQCKRSNNQLFSWFGASENIVEEKQVHLNHIVSSKNGRCIAAGVTASATVKPTPGSILTLRPCEGGDKSMLWRYAHGIEQIVLEHFPDLCMTLDKEGKLAIDKCKVHNAWSSPEQWFRVVDLGVEPIKDHVPLKIRQNKWCLDQRYDATPDQLVLYHCKPGENQEFVWRGHASWGYHFLVSNLDDKCLGIERADTDATGKPRLEAPIRFKRCSAEDDLIKWVYDYGSQQLKMKKWSSLCLDFNDKFRFFTVWKCHFEEYTGAFGSSSFKQRVEFRTEKEVEKIPIGVPVKIRAGTWGHCLDRPPRTNLLQLYDCKLKQKGFSINQEYMWHGNTSWDYSWIVSLVDDKCLGVDGVNGVPTEGSLVTIRECVPTDNLIRWSYSYGKGFMKLAHWPNFCIDFDERNGNSAIVTECHYGSGPFELAKSNQEVEILGLGLKRIEDDTPLSIFQNGWCLDQPWCCEDHVQLYSCHKNNNQRFVWHSELGWQSHVIMSHIDNTCIGIARVDVDATQRPKPGTHVKFRSCDFDDPLIHWTYAYGPEQLRMAEYQDLCMEFSDGLRRFIVNKCVLLDGSGQDNRLLGLGYGVYPAHNQAIMFDGVMPTRRRRSRRREENAKSSGSSQMHTTHRMLLEEQLPIPGFV